MSLKYSTAKLSFILVLIFPVYSFAQKCNYEKNEMDAMTEFSIKLTAPELLCRINGQPVYVKAQCIGSHKYLKFQYYKYSNYVIQEDREVGLITTSGDEVFLFPRVMPVDSIKIDTYDSGMALLIFKLSNEQYETLKNNPIVTFRYYLISGWVQEAIKGSKQTRIMEVLRCVE
jgi:hypothetical protein